jgi:hypothetical protein
MVEAQLFGTALDWWGGILLEYFLNEVFFAV